MKDSPLLSQTFLLLILALVLYLFYRILQPFLFSLILAMALVSLFYPNFLRLTRIMRGRATIASVLMCLVITILILIPFALLSIFLVNELNEAYSRYLAHPENFEALLAKPYPAFLEPFMQRLARLLQRDEIDLRALGAARLEDLARYLISQSSAILGSVGWLIINFVVMIFSMFFLFRDGHLLVNRLRSLLPLSSSYQDVLFSRLYGMVQATFLGIFVTGLCQGVLAAIVFSILGIEKPVIWAAAVTCVSIIPIVGTGAVWIPMSVYLMVSGSMGRGIALFLLGAFAISSVDNIVRPLVIEGRARGMHVLVLFFGLAGGLLFFGPTGVLLGPLVIALLMALLEIYSLEIRKRNDASS